MAKDRHKHVITVVVETDEKVTKKALKEWLLGFLMDDTGTPRTGTFQTDEVVVAVRVRSVDLD